MSSVSFLTPRLQQPQVATWLDCATARSTWKFWLAAAVVGMAFFVTENDTSISLADAFTQTADEMHAATSGGNILRRFAFFAVAGLGGMLLLQTGGRPWKINSLLATAIVAYVGWCGISIFWSIAPGLCLRRLVVLGCTSLGALGIARQFTMRELSQLALAVTGSIVCIGVLAEIRLGTFRPWSGEYRFSGSVHPNTQGMYLAVLVLSAWGLGRSANRGRWACWLVLGVAMGLLVLTKSRTGLAALLVSMAAVLMLQTSFRFKALLGVFGGCAGGAALLALLLVGIDPLTDFRDAALLGRSEQTESFSGRTMIWPEVLYSISKHPLTGHGYESYWTADHVDGMFEAVGWAVREAHCGYLEVLLSTGIIGLGLVLLVTLLSLVSTSRSYLRQRDPTYGLPFGMLVFGLLDSTMESGLVFINLGTFLVVCCLMRIAFFGERQCTTPPLGASQSTTPLRDAPQCTTPLRGAHSQEITP